MMYLEVKHADSCPLSMPIHQTGNYECTCFIDQARKRIAALDAELAAVTAERDEARKVALEQMQYALICEHQRDTLQAALSQCAEALEYGYIKHLSYMSDMSPKKATDALANPVVQAVLGKRDP